MVQGFYTDTTCNEACWMAKEDICRCSCNGVNHGIYRRDSDAPQPTRTRRIKSTVYRLYAVASRFDAYRIEHAFYKYGIDNDPMLLPTITKWYNHPAHDIKCSKATDAQVLNWPEFKAFFTQLDALAESGARLAVGDILPYCIWIPNSLTPEWLDVHPIEYIPARSTINE